MRRPNPESPIDGAAGDKKPYATPQLTVYEQLETLTAGNVKQPGGTDFKSSVAHSGGGFP